MIDGTDNTLRRVALEHLALLLLQEGRRAAANAILQSEGYKYTFADCVVRYAVPTHSLANTGGPRRVSPAATIDVDKCVRVYCHALPVPVLKKLQTAFAPKSPFWSEHGYSTTTRGGEKKGGYFSYAYSTAKPSAGANLIQQVAAHFLKLYTKDFPALAECNFVEWWAHCRPHSDGHQMHFDSADEGVGEVRNPIASAVLYLSCSGLGGPTLVTTQRLGDEDVARSGWLVHPICNAAAMFDGKLLHGVIPGRSLPPTSALQAAAAVDDEANAADTEAREAAASARFSLPMGPRRVTLMLAFWRRLRLRPFCACAPSAAQTFPAVETTIATWPSLLAAVPASSWATAKVPQSVPVQSVAPIWTPIKGDSAEQSLPAYSECFQYPRRP